MNIKKILYIFIFFCLLDDHNAIARRHYNNSYIHNLQNGRFYREYSPQNKFNNFLNNRTTFGILPFFFHIGVDVAMSYDNIPQLNNIQHNYGIKLRPMILLTFHELINPFFRFSFSSLVKHHNAHRTNDKEGKTGDLMFIDFELGNRFIIGKSYTLLHSLSLSFMYGIYMHNDMCKQKNKEGKCVEAYNSPYLVSKKGYNFGIGIGYILNAFRIFELSVGIQYKRLFDNSKQIAPGIKKENDMISLYTSIGWIVL